MEQKWQVPQDPQSHLLNPLNELKVRGFDTLLQNLFVDLKVVGAFSPVEHPEPVLGGRQAWEGLRRNGGSTPVWCWLQVSGGAQGWGPRGSWTYPPPDPGACPERGPRAGGAWRSLSVSPYLAPAVPKLVHASPQSPGSSSQPHA